MDASIRQLLAAANIVKNEETAKKHLFKAFKLLESASKDSSDQERTQSCGVDLYVLAAELAFKLQETKIAETCLIMYFHGTPLTDQFLCRAYLCQADLLAAAAPESTSALDSAVVYLLKAINFARDKPRYHFIVYNASVLFWKMARPFMREGARGILHTSLQHIVKALEDIDDKDHEWRSTLLILSIQSLIDAGKLKQATKVSENAAEFTLQNSKFKFKEVFKLQVKHQLVDVAKLQKQVSTIPEYTVFFKVQKLKRSVAENQCGENIDIRRDIESLINIISPKPDKPPASPGELKSSRRGSSSSVSSTTLSSSSPGRKRSTVFSKPILPILTEEDLSEMGKEILKPLLLEMARLCADQDEVELSFQCLALLKEQKDLGTSMELEIDCLECYLYVKKLGDKQHPYTKLSVDVRLYAIKRLDQTIQNAVRSASANVVQSACVTQWNLCLPLLQVNLRKHVRRPLTLVAQALENISSLLIKLRCQIHTELAKCEEDVEQVETAMKHLRKAIQLDQTGFYHHRLHTMLRRLELSTQLYKSPETPEDTAAVIIEQARKSADSGSIRMKRSLLVKAGLALAPDAFQYVLDSESDVKTVGTGTKYEIEIHKLGAKANQWKICTHKAVGHLKRLGDENDRERVRLWADLAKVARRQEVWDVCRVAARFCLLYDDDRWQVKEEQQEATPTKPPATADTEPNGNPPQSAAEQSTTVDQSGIIVTNSDDDNTFYNSDLIRLLAEVNFINGESLIHLLQCEGFKLNQVPNSPKGVNIELDFDYSFIDNTDWQSYVEWIKALSSSSTKAFLRAISLGVSLRESWIVCSGTSYLWNYNNHLLMDKNYSELVNVFDVALQGLQAVGHSTETVLLVRICNLIAQGLLKRWLPPKPSKLDAQTPIETSKTPVSKNSSRNKTPGKDKNAGNANQVVSVDPEGLGDLKRALEVSEYALNVTDGEILNDVVPTYIREDMIATWVLLKQMLQQQIGSELGTEKEVLVPQKNMTKGIVALECHTVNKNGMVEMTVPGLEEVTEIIANAEWDDTSVELKVWVRLAHLCSLAKEIALVKKCCKNALKFKKLIKERIAARTKGIEHSDIVDCEMLCYAACIQGENILCTVTSNPFARRQALESFVNSAKFGDMAGNYTLVMAACKRWWNACLPLMSTAIERELLQKPLKILLHCITSTVIKSKASTAVENKDLKTVPVSTLGITVTGDDNQDVNTDNAVRAAMYGIYFQTFTDKGLWEDALNEMDQAVHHMPRTKHRLLIFKHRIMVKAKLGRNVFADIAKFREESEEYVAHMWHKVALSSHEQMQQIQSYQRAIESLHSEETQWKKVDYLAEMGSWLFCNEFPKEDAINVLEWAVDILLSMKFEVEFEVEKPVSAKGKAKKGVGKGTKPPASRGSAKTRESKSDTKSEAISKPTTADNAAEDGKPVEDTGGENAEDYIPVEKNVIIGLEASNLDLKLLDLNSVRQLEYLLRIHIMLATMAGRGSKEHKIYCLLAVGFVMRIWQIALNAAGLLLSKFPKIEVPEVKGQKGANSQPATTTKDKGQKRSGPLNALPEDVISWAKYEVPDDIRRAFLFNTTETAISCKTICKPTLSVYYMQELCAELSLIGYDHLTLPVFALTEVFIHDIIQSKSWSQMIRIKQIKTCYDINLFEAAKYWESVVGEKFLPEAEQAAFLQEIELVKQHAKQVKHEEERIKGQAGKNNLPTFEDKPEEIVSVVTLQGEKIGKLDMKKIWFGKAKALLELGYHQESRKLLDQSLKAAKFYDDKLLEGDIDLVLAQLSLQEANYGQAMEYLKHAEAIAGDEQYWIRVVKMLVGAILQNPDVNEDDFEACIHVMKHTILTFEILQQQRPTKASTIGFAINFFKSKLALLKINVKLDRDTRIRETIYTEFAKLEESENSLKNFNRVRELAIIYRKHAKLLLSIAKKGSSNPKEIHSLLISGIKALKSGISLLQAACFEIKRTTEMKKSSELVLPIEKELCDISLDYVTFCLYVYEVNAKEKCSSKETQAKTGSLEHIVQEYIGYNPKSSPIETEWHTVGINLPQQIISYINDVHISTAHLPDKRAKCLLLCGRCLRLLSVHSRDNINSHWHVEKLNGILKLSEENVEAKYHDQLLLGAGKSSNRTSRVGSTRSKSSTASSLTIRQKTKLIENASRIVNQEEYSQNLMVTSNEILLQCLKLAIELQMTNIISEATYELVESTGQFDPALTSQFLALHQSAVSALEMKDLIKNSQTDSTVSKFSALVHQQEWLNDNFGSSYMPNSTIGSWISSSLLNFNGWKRIQILPRHFDLLKDFPPTFNFIVLQHTSDGKSLYASIMDRPSATATTADKSKSKDKSQSSSRSRAQVQMIPVDPKTMPMLLEKMEDWGIRHMSLLLQTEYQRAQSAMRLKMLQQLAVDGDAPMTQESNTALDEQEEEEMKVMEEFKEILEDVEAYLEPVTTLIKEKLIDQIVQDGVNEIAQGTEANPNAMETVVLLLDSQLLQLPLEALRCFQTPFIDCICRDFSLQFLHHRWYVDPDEAAAAAEKKKNDVKNIPKSTAAKDSRKTPGGGAKVVPLNRDIIPGCKAVSTNSFHYVVDPLLETAETEKYKPIEAMNEVIQTYMASCTSMWAGLKGTDGVPSIGKWENTINNCEAFIFYGMERFLANFTPSKVVSMNLDDCMMFVLLEKAQTNKSFRHQSKVDVDKSNFQLHLEKPLQTVMLLSLVGANTICTNQWHSTLEDNAGKLHSIAKTILDEGRIIGKAIKKMINPTLEKPTPPEPVPQAMPAAGKDVKGGKGSKPGKAESRKGKRSPISVPVTPDIINPESEEIVEDKVEEVIPEPVDIQESWCNFVLFGLPNIMVA